MWRGILLSIGLALLVSGCDEEVYRGLSPRDANEMTALLRKNSITASREASEGNTFRVVVPKEDFAKAVDLLSKSGFPKERYRSLGEVFPGDGLIVSPFEQRARLVFATNQELSRTIGDIEGVVSARVHVVLPEQDLRGLTPSRASASVVVHHRTGVDPSELTPKVRLIVANAVPDLSYRDVSIAFFNAEDGTGSMRREPSVTTKLMDSLAGPISLIQTLVPPLLWVLAILAIIVALLMLVRRARTT